jgi:hypothetical protein
MKAAIRLQIRASRKNMSKPHSTIAAQKQKYSQFLLSGLDLS